MTVTFDDVLAAHERIRPWIHRTPLMTSATFDAETGVEAVFKCENLQKIGAFKARGALNAVLTLDDSQAAQGVVTHSSGNHGAALAWAARLRGIPATVVMPRTASPMKVAAVEGYGARIVRSDLHDRQEVAERVLAESGGTLIHPYEHPAVIAGQATATVELLEDAGTLDAVVVPVGGGGLSSGAVLATAARAPTTHVIGVEPASADEAQESLAAGRLVPARTNPSPLADGLLAGLGPTTFRILSTAAIRIVTVDDSAIVDACRFHLHRMKLLVEPSGAVGTAALRLLAADMPGARVGVLISGGNTDLGWL
jgi:threonine dehydratase